MGVSAVEGESRASHRQISSLNNSVLWESLLQVIDRAIGVRDVACERESDGGKSFTMFPFYRFESGLCILFSEVGQSDQRFADRIVSLVLCRGFIFLRSAR